MVTISKIGHLNNFFFNRIDFNSSDYDEFGYMLKVAFVEEKLLEAGSFTGVANIVTTSHVIICNFEVNKKVLQIGTGIPGYITFIIWDPKVSFSWRKNEMKDGMIGVLWKNEHQSVTGTGFNGLPISIEENFFFKLCQIKGYPELIHQLKKSELFHVSKSSLIKIRNLLKLVTQVNTLEDSVIYELIEDKLVNLLINCLASNLTERTSEDLTNPKFVKVIDYIHENLTEITSVNQVCENTNVSGRTLRRMMQKKYNLTTKTYINSLRLNQVRKELKSESNNSYIFQVASEYNFWHMGQFTRDYKHHFGELPSETIKK